MTEAALHYHRVARILHWTIGVLVIYNLVSGITHDWLGEVAGRDAVIAVMGLHKSIGFLVLALSIVRLVWRLTHPAPPLPVAMPVWEKVAAHGLHWLFYALMFVLPMTGWIMSSAGKNPIPFFGLFEIPKFAVEKGSGLAEGTHNAHVVLGYSWAVLMLVHVGAALRHHFILKDNILPRMWRAAPGA